jgi:hypothetical protein
METEWFKKRMSEDPGADPVVEDARKPQMEEEPPPPRRIGGKTLLMAEEPRAPTRKTGRMEPLPERATRAKKQRLPLEDQLQPPIRRRARADEERYLRIRVHLEDDTLSVQHIKEVDGPLVAHEDLHGDMAYEVTVGGERVASASIPDAGVNRAFPPLEPVAGQEGHFFAPAPSQDVLVRVPRDAISLRALPRVEIALYRVKEGPLPRTEDTKPLKERFSRELREVARLRGISLDDLPRSARAEARRALK